MIIGKIRFKKSFTLIELSCAVAILSFGVIVAVKGLLSSLAALDEAKYRLLCLDFMDDKIMEIRLSARAGEDLTPNSSRGDFDIEGKKFQYIATLEEQDGSESLMRAKVICYWKRGSRKMEIVRSFICRKGAD